MVQILLSKYATEWWLIYNIACLLYAPTLGNFKILKIMNLASNCRHPLWFPLLCRKWVWLSWSLWTVEWKSTASITAMSHSLSRCCQRSNMLQAIRLSFNKNNSHLKKQRLTPWQTWFIQSTCVADSRMLCSLLRCCVVHPVDRFDSEEWFSSDQVIF